MRIYAGQWFLGSSSYIKQNTNLFALQVSCCCALALGCPSFLCSVLYIIKASPNIYLASRRIFRVHVLATSCRHLRGQSRHRSSFALQFALIYIWSHLFIFEEFVFVTFFPFSRHHRVFISVFECSLARPHLSTRHFLSCMLRSHSMWRPLPVWRMNIWIILASRYYCFLPSGTRATIQMLATSPITPNLQQLTTLFRSVPF